MYQSAELLLFLCPWIRLFSVPFTQAREARETGEARARKKIEASFTLWLAFVSLSHFSRFA